MIELGRRKAVGGQEDWIIEVAHEISEKRRVQGEAMQIV